MRPPVPLTVMVRFRGFAGIGSHRHSDFQSLQTIHHDFCVFTPQGAVESRGAGSQRSQKQCPIGDALGSGYRYLRFDGSGWRNNLEQAGVGSRLEA